MIDWIKSWDPFLGVIVSTTVILGFAFPLIRGWMKRTKALNKKLEAGMDSLLGYGPVLDPATGAVLKPATPSMAVRVDTIEQAILSMAQTQKQMTELNVRVTSMEEWRDKHQLWSDSTHPHPAQIVQNFGPEPH